LLQVAEVFVGLPEQWRAQYRASPGLPPTWAPNERFLAVPPLTPAELTHLFEGNRGKGHILYQLEAGNENRDHEWLVEQLPGDGGYRVLQSYMWAFR